MDAPSLAAQPMRAGKAPVKPRFYASVCQRLQKSPWKDYFEIVSCMDAPSLAAQPMRAGKAPVKPRFYASVLFATPKKVHGRTFLGLNKEQKKSPTLRVGLNILSRER